MPGPTSATMTPGDLFDITDALGIDAFLHPMSTGIEYKFERRKATEKSSRSRIPLSKFQYFNYDFPYANDKQTSDTFTTRNLYQIIDSALFS